LTGIRPGRAANIIFKALVALLFIIVENNQRHCRLFFLIRGYRILPERVASVLIEFNEENWPIPQRNSLVGEELVFLLFPHALGGFRP